MLGSILMIVILGSVLNAQKVIKFRPEAVHLSLGESSTELVVTWSTIDDTNESTVEYGIGGLNLVAKGYRKKFVDGGNEKRSQFIHRVTLKKLLPGETYDYHCGSRYGWSDKFTVTIPSNSSDWMPQIVLFGDMGNENAQSLSRMQRETQLGLYHVAIHVGDFAYDMNSNNGKVGDEFMRQIEGIAAYLPYMTVAGNHEERYNFSNYRARFSMPGDSESLWYSFNLGPIHFIAIDTEVYYFMNYGIKQLVKQYMWLKADLEEANKPENRAKRPWIITFGHRPMYCSNDNGDDCTNHGSLVRVGLPFLNFFGLEDLFYHYRVDLEIWAHEHSYERLWPLYNFQVYNGSDQAPYTNYKAPVHIVTGSAGCKEGKEKFLPDQPPWSAFRSSDYGYTRIKAFNKTHLYLEQVSDDKGGKILDHLWLIKDEIIPKYSQNVDI